MRARLRATGRYSTRDFAGLRSVMDLDDRVTAPSFGFGNAANYYRTQSALAFLDRIRVPVLLIQAKDDTFIPFEIFKSAAVRGNRRIELLVTEHGGHLGFLGRRPHRLWADHAIMNWIQSQSAKMALSERV
jgi:predicted alpha/beta-fold hydrolase